MAPVPKQRATYADLERLPDNVVGEIVAGALYASPRPRVTHAVTSSALGAELTVPFQFGRGGPGGWWILDEPELHFGDDVLVPDLAGWRIERMPSPPDVAAIELAPDWICEVLSPSTARLDRKGKLPIYAQRGVSHAWLIDPAVRTLEVLRRDRTLWTLIGTYADQDRVRVEPFEAIELDLSLLWGVPTAPEPAR
ncbi:MAG: Uma2 family endonuclease [Deltaproteobacteria bacterium]|nr:Uma2 family endonuclease [Deltaproteobacteria bacterium]